MMGAGLTRGLNLNWETCQKTGVPSSYLSSQTPPSPTHIGPHTPSVMGTLETVRFYPWCQVVRRFENNIEGPKRVDDEKTFTTTI